MVYQGTNILLRSWQRGLFSKYYIGSGVSSHKATPTGTSHYFVPVRELLDFTLNITIIPGPGGLDLWLDDLNVMIDNISMVSECQGVEVGNMDVFYMQHLSDVYKCTYSTNSPLLHHLDSPLMWFTQYQSLSPLYNSTLVCIHWQAINIWHNNILQNIYSQNNLIKSTNPWYSLPHFGVFNLFFALGVHIRRSRMRTMDYNLWCLDRKIMCMYNTCYVTNTSLVVSVRVVKLWTQS